MADDADDEQRENIASNTLQNCLQFRTYLNGGVTNGFSQNYN